MDFKYAVIDGFPVEVKTALVSVGASTTASVVAAVTGKKLRVIYLSLFADNVTNANFRTNTTDISGSIRFSTTGIVFPLVPKWFETVAGEPLTVNNASATNVTGIVGYIEV